MLVLLFRDTDDGLDYAVFQREDDGAWQGVAGGAEAGETAADAAFRETAEEAGLRGRLFRLDCFDTVPARCFADRTSWAEGTFVVPQHFFAMDVSACGDVVLSDEHAEFRWLPFDEAHRLLRYDSNKTALEELNERLHTGWLGHDREVGL
ncbi:MAG: NUDIX hydrolase [Stackebrandtia sp.]